MQLHMQQILNLLSQNSKPKIKTTSIKLSQQIITPQQFQLYPQQLKNIYQEFFNDQLSQININQLLPFKPYPTKMPICNKVLNTIDQAYKCYDCFLHQNAVLCEKCFENGQHAGHRYKKINSGGGNCDCGNSQPLKNRGFCKNHSGKAEIPKIPQSDIQQFLKYMIPIMDWFFKLKKTQDKQNFSQVLFKFIMKLNQQSLYYNLLTQKLLISKRQNQTQTILQQSFHLQNDTIIKKFKQLYFTLFTLQSFKITLANAFLNAYNTIELFEKKPFHNLFIQLFANDTVVLEICNKYQNTFKITKKNYDYEKYLQDLSFISSLQNEPAFAFYELYLNKNSTIPFTPLDIIQNQLEKSQQLHLVDAVSNYINLQNFFYVTVNSIATKIQNNTKLLIKFVKGFFQQIQSQTYSYTKNKAILPYHRAYAITLFTLFKGNIEEISIESIAFILQITKQRVTNFYEKNTKTVINCLIQFSQTFSRRTYFDNYINLYVKSGSICINYDFLFIRQAIEIMKKQNIPISINQLHQSPNETFDEYLLKNIFFIHILIETCVSNLPIIILNQKISINNPQINKKRKQIFISILNTLKSVNLQELTILAKYFISQTNDQFLIENTIYNKNTKKYTLHPQLTQNTNNFQYQTYISKTKTPQTLLNSNNNQNPISSQSIPNPQIPILISYKSILNLTQKIINSKQQLISTNSLKTVIKTFKRMLHCLSLYVNNSYPLKQIDFMITNNLPELQQSQNIPQIPQKQKIRRQQIKKQKQQILKSKRKLTIQKFQQNPQNQDTCLFCKQQKQNQTLFYFTTIKYKKLLNNQTQQNQSQKYQFLYNSCFHKVHQTCSINNTLTQNKYKCPLCKKYSNLLLPVYSQTLNPTLIQTLQKINQIINSLSTKLPQNQNPSQKYFYVLKSFISSIIESVAFIGVFSVKQFNNNYRKISLEITKIVKILWQNWNPKQQQNILNYFLNPQKQTNPITNQKQTLLLSIKQYITHKFFAHLQQSLPQKNLQQKLTQNINPQDLQTIQSNLSFIFNQSPKPHKIHSQQKQFLTKIINLFNYFIPPLNVKQLFIKRDQTKIHQSNCKPGHNVLICCLCEKVVCQECKCMLDHIKSHGSETVYFSLLNGSILLASNKIYKMESFYENSLGLPWTPDKEPDNFQLNLQDYNDLILNFLFHCMNSYVRKTKKINTVTLNNYEDLSNIF